eukprot:1445880-Pleurochrysis_carterae.AAC.1
MPLFGPSRCRLLLLRAHAQDGREALLVERLRGASVSRPDGAHRRSRSKHQAPSGHFACSDSSCA